MQNIIASAGMQFTSFPLVPTSGITQTDTTMMSSVGQTCNFQNMSENSVTSSDTPCIPSSITSSSQQGKQYTQQIASQHFQQQSKNEHTYQTQMDDQIANHKHCGNNQPSLTQLPIHHNHQVMNPAETAQLQSPQQSRMHTLQGLQLRQPTHQQAQPSHIQSTPSSGYPENQQSIIQQFRSPALQQQSQSILQMQQSVQIQRTEPTQQTVLSSNQNHQVSGKHPNETNIQHNQLTGQPCAVSDMQQQPEKQLWLATEQSNLLRMPQQQFLGEQNHILNSHQQQLSAQQNVSGLHWNSMHSLEEAEIIEDQQRAKQKLLTSFLRQGQQSQSQILQQREMFQLHTNQAEFQQQLRAQNTSNPLQRDRDMNQRIQMSSQIATGNQKHLFQFQGGHSEASSNSLVPNGRKDVDEREEVHQKVRSMKEMYMPYLLGIYNKIRPQQTTNSRAIDAYKECRFWLESIISMLNTSPSNIPLNWTVDKLLSKERSIFYFIRRCRTKRNAFPQQQEQNQLHPSVSHSLQPQISQLKHTDYQMNTLMQPINLKTSVATMQPNVLSLQHDSMPSPSFNLGVPAIQTNLVSPLQPGSDLESIHGNALSSLQQGAVGSLQKVPLNATEQERTNTSSQNSINVLQHNVKSLQPSPNVLHHQYPKQQFHQCDLSHQLVQQQQKQDTMQQQKQKLLQRHPHPYQMDDISDMHGMQSMNVKSGMLPQHHTEGRKFFYNYQPPLTPRVLLPSSSPQSLQASSPRTSQHSPQTEPQSMISSSLLKSGTLIQSASSPMISLSPSTCFTPSPIPSDYEKQNTDVPFHTNAGGKRQAVTSGPQSHSLVIDTPGILSPALLAEVAIPDKNQGCASTVISGKTIETESPTERMIKVVKSMSHKALRSSVCDIYSTVSVVDKIAGSRPDNHSEARVGEDLAAMAKHSLLARNFLSQDGVVTAKNMNFLSSGLPMTVVTSDGSVYHSSKLSNGIETSDLDSTATSRIKRPRVEVNEAILEEIKDINWQLVNTVLDVSEKDNSLTSALYEVGHGTIVKCSFTPFSFSPSQAFPVLPIYLLVSVNYPNTSPVLLDKLPLCLSEEHERFLVEARSQLLRSMHCLPQPMSLKEMAKSWDTCARTVLMEYALQNGGGSFSSRYGTWKNVVSTG